MARMARIGRILVRGALYFAAACALLWLMQALAPQIESMRDWAGSAISTSGARLNLRLGGITLAFDRSLLALLQEKWSALCAASARLIPPGAAKAVGQISAAIAAALGKIHV